MPKRRWWLADERFKAVHKNLRANYDAAIKRLESKHADDISALDARLEQRLKDERIRHSQDLARAEEFGSKLAGEIARMRLEFGPQKFGTRFVLYVTMDENFMLNARDLKDYAGYVIEILAAKVKVEFQQIDFSRAKPVVPDRMPREGEYPVFRIDA